MAELTEELMKKSKAEAKAKASSKPAYPSCLCLARVPTSHLLGAGSRSDARKARANAQSTSMALSKSSSKLKASQAHVYVAAAATHCLGGSPNADYTRGVQASTREACARVGEREGACCLLLQAVLVDEKRSKHSPPILVCVIA